MLLVSYILFFLVICIVNINVTIQFSVCVWGVAVFICAIESQWNHQFYFQIYW